LTLPFEVVALILPPVAASMIRKRVTMQPKTMMADDRIERVGKPVGS
jgi:hypothetical protein